MPRLINGERKIQKPRPENAGKLLIFCEGNTEFNYLMYFKTYLENNLHAQYSDIVIEPINANGDARRVYDYAEAFLADAANASRYFYFEKHLVFDCDAPDNIQEVVNLMNVSENEYILDYSNLMFETWLVMHFQDLIPDGDNRNRTIIRLMCEYLDIDRYTSKDKASPGTIGKILGSNANEKIRAAIKNAKELEAHWCSLGMREDVNIKEMNPSVAIYTLIERLMDEIVYLCG